MKRRIFDSEDYSQFKPAKKVRLQSFTITPDEVYSSPSVDFQYPDEESVDPCEAPESKQEKTLYDILLRELLDFIFAGGNAQPSGILMRSCVVAYAIDPDLLGDKPSQSNIAEFLGVSKALLNKEMMAFRKRFNFRFQSLTKPDWARQQRSEAMKVKAKTK